MTSVFDLPSFGRDQLTAKQRAKYTTIEVGESWYTGRRTFQVICNDCKRVLHDQTNGPEHYMELHDKQCKENQNDE